MRLLGFVLLFGFAFVQSSVYSTRISEYQYTKICNIMAMILEEYAQTLESLDECIQINENRIANETNKVIIASSAQELMHYLRCKYLILRMMRKAHPLCLWVDSDGFKEFAAEMLEIYEKEFGAQ